MLAFFLIFWPVSRYIEPASADLVWLVYCFASEMFQ